MPLDLSLRGHASAETTLRAIIPRGRLVCKTLRGRRGGRGWMRVIPPPPLASLFHHGRPLLPKVQSPPPLTRRWRECGHFFFSFLGGGGRGGEYVRKNGRKDDGGWKEGRPPPSVTPFSQGEAGKNFCLRGLNFILILLSSLVMSFLSFYTYAPRLSCTRTYTQAHKRKKSNC